MLKKTVIVMSLLIFSMLCVEFSSFDLKASSDHPVHNLNTGLSYISIQEAINAPETSGGHTILVDVGTYYESVVVNKSVSIVGADKDTTIIDGNRSSIGLCILSDDVFVSNLTIVHCGEGGGLCVDEVGNVQISDIIACNNDAFGVHLIPGSHNVNITRTTIMNNSEGGLILNQAWKVNIYNSTIVSNNGSGIIIHNGANHSIVGNNMTDNLFGISLVDGSLVNTIFGNIIVNSSVGIFSNNCSDLYIRNNVIMSNYIGIHCLNNSDPLIQGNIIMSNGGGITLTEYCAGTIQGNSIVNNSGSGVALWDSGPLIQGNIVALNGEIGICCVINSLPEVHWNDIYDKPWGVTNEDNSLTVNATYNYWGDGPSTSINVTYDPRLTESIFRVEITDPLSREAVSSIVTISTQVNARSGLEKVEFYVDNKPENVDYDAPYEWNWDTTQCTQTEHEITAKAYDMLGLEISTSVTVFVDNTPPTVSIEAPTSQNTYNGTINVKANATDNRELSNVHLRVGNTEWLVMTKDPVDLFWKYDLNTTILSDGQHTITVLALDKAGNPTTNSTTLFTDNNPPTLAIRTPQSGMTVGITLIVDVEAADVSGISRIEFYLQDVLTHTATSTPYQWSWDTTKYPNGEYRIVVKAYDMLGIVQTREATVTVENAEPAWWQTDFWTFIQVLVGIGGLLLAVLTYVVGKKKKKKKSD
jgi:parallel beta-helix repeat protein